MFKLLHKKKYILYITGFFTILAFFLLLSGQKSDIWKKKTISLLQPKTKIECFEVLTIRPAMPLNLDLELDSAKVEIFNCDGEYLKFELTKKISEVWNDENSKINADDFIIKLDNYEGKISYMVKYTGSIKNPVDKMTNLRVFLPEKYKYVLNSATISFFLDFGSIKFVDDFRGIINGSFGVANIEINNIDGSVNLKGNNGNININGGCLKNDSSISVNSGNLNIKCHDFKSGIFTFITRFGTINMSVPKYMPIKLESSRETNNTLTGSKNNPDVNLILTSILGKINVEEF